MPLLSAASPPPVDAQPSAVAGVVRAEDGGAPIPFALVRLIPADSTAPQGILAQGITNAEGRFWFGGLKAGRYRVQLLRIGYKPVFSEPLPVAAGETAQFPLLISFQPLQLPAVNVRADGCVPAATLGQHPQLLLLWQQGRAGAAIHEGLMARYRYRIVRREEGFEHGVNDSTTPGVRLDTLISNPKYALSNAKRRRELRLSRGYAGPVDGSWSLPDELDVLHEDFLRSHCIDPVVERGAGEIGLRFAPTRTRRGIWDLRVTLWLDSASFLTRRLELEYLADDVSLGTVRIDYADVTLAGGVLRMPGGGSYLLRKSKRNPDQLTEGTLTFSYSDFEEEQLLPLLPPPPNEQL
jgi:hypothetical protein